jgi:hypothetical protein
LTERVSNGIMRSKHGFGLMALAVAAALAFASGCAQKGSPVEPPGELGGYRVVGTLPIVGYAVDLEVTGDLCLIAADQGGLVLVDVSDPAAPVQLSVVDTDYPASGCSYIASDSLAFATVGAQGVQVYDVSDPTDPAYESAAQGGFGRDVITRDVNPGVSHEVLVADGYGMITYECYYSSSFNQWLIQPRDSVGGLGVSRGIGTDGSYALLAKEEVGLVIYDAANITNVVYVGGVDTPGEGRAVAASGDYAYVADWRKGLQVVDISDPADPMIVGSAETDGLADGVAYSDGKVFVAAHVGGLEVFDVSDPTDPVAFGRLETPYAYDVFVTDDYVYIADRDWGLVIAEEE